MEPSDPVRAEVVAAVEKLGRKRVAELLHLAPGTVDRVAGPLKLSEGTQALLALHMPALRGAMNEAAPAAPTDTPASGSAAA